MLAELVRQLTKIKKKHGDIPVLYVYGDLSEMAIAHVTKAQVVYTNIDIHEGLIYMTASEYKESNFISEKVYNAETHKEFKPVIFIME